MLTDAKTKEYYQALLNKDKNDEEIFYVGVKTTRAFCHPTCSARKQKKVTVLKASWLDTQLGSMLAIADDNALYLLEFVDRRGLEREIERLRARLNAAIIPGKTAPIESIEKELTAYFEGTLTVFHTPLFLLGSSFQKTVWDALCQIPYGATKSYAEQAKIIGKPTASRAVANANGANQLAIVIPCHRVITSSGALGGYGGGITRKQWLLQHEKIHSTSLIF